MVEVAANLSNIIYWGDVNEEKSKSPTKLDYDILLNFSYKDKLAPIVNPDDVVSVIFDVDKESIECEPLYEGVNEYKIKDQKKVAEVIKGLEYTLIKLYGKDFDLDEIKKRLQASKASNKKANLSLEIPDRPKKIDEKTLRNFRYKYSEEEQINDDSLTTKNTIKSIIRGFFYLVVAAVVIIFMSYEIFFTKFQNVTLPTENFIAKKGNLVGYDANGVLTLFMFSDPVDGLGVDERAMLFIPELVDVTDRIIVEKATDSLENVLYEKGASQVEYSSYIEGYSYVKANLFKFDTYKNRTAGEADWDQYGQLGTGKAKQIMIRARIVEMEDGYYLSLGSGFAKLGDIAEEGERFYDQLMDSESYITSIFSLITGRPVYVYGQVEKTFTPKEGRNNKDKKLFVFKVTYVRSRAS